MKKHGHRHQCGGSQRKVWVVKGKWVKYIVMEGDLTLGGKHDVIYRWYALELNIWNLYNVIKQYHPYKSN